VISLFKKKETPPVVSNFLQVDMHSHLLPGIDDGCANIEESVKCIEQLKKRGYKKLIITPHIISGYYENTPEIINDKLDYVRTILDQRNIKIELGAAAEYYVDEQFIELLKNGHRFLTFGKNYILIELGFYNEPAQFTTTIFQLLSEGYKPVLAHPERYLYLLNQFDKIKEWVEKGLLLQINRLSLIGYYSPSAQLFSEKLINEDMVSFAGTDAHNPKHLEILLQIYNSKYFQKLATCRLLNNSLL
jgi:protein-tyrosine phosphatase